MYTIAQAQFYFSAMSLLLIAISIPLVKKLVKPNPLYGFRIRRTMEDEDLWYRANSYSGKLMIIVAVITHIAALVLSHVSISPENYGLACSVIMVGGLIVTVIMTMIDLNRIP